jgi:hypothetical protein
MSPDIFAKISDIKRQVGQVEPRRTADYAFRLAR